MTITRRTAMTGLLAAPAILRAGAARADARVLKISHQFPGGTIEQGDFRDRLVRRFAADVQAKTGGALSFEIYPGSSLMKTVAQFSALRRGALDFSLYPLAYAGGEVPEVNISLMPCITTSYEQGMAWKTNDIGRELTALLDKRGVKIITWIWQGGGIASRAGAVVAPGDVRGLKARGASRDMDVMLKAAGGIISSVTSDETYAAMQTGACDAVITSSTSLISFRLEELSKALTSGRERSYWFMLEPIMMSKTVFSGLPKDQQDLIMAVGAELEAFGQAGAKADDTRVEQIFSKAGAKVSQLDEKSLGQWRELARETAWKDYAGRNASCAELLKLAEQVA